MQHAKCCWQYNREISQPAMPGLRRQYGKVQNFIGTRFATPTFLGLAILSRPSMQAEGLTLRTCGKWNDMRWHSLLITPTAITDNGKFVCVTVGATMGASLQSTQPYSRSLLYLNSQFYISESNYKKLGATLRIKEKHYKYQANI